MADARRVASMLGMCGIDAPGAYRATPGAGTLGEMELPSALFPNDCAVELAPTAKPLPLGLRLGSPLFFAVDLGVILRVRSVCF